MKTTEFKSNEIDGALAGPGSGEYGAAVSMSEEFTFNLEIDSSAFNDQVLSENMLGATSIAAGVITGSLAIVNSTFNEPIVLDGLGAHPPMVYVDDFDAEGVFTVAHSTFIGDYAIRVNENEGGTWTISHSAFDSATDAHPINTDDSDIPTDYSAFSAIDPGEVDDVTGNKIGVGLLLGAYGYNGGPTQTAVPLTGSPLIDTGNPAAVNPPEFDQRSVGFDRVVRIIDIGAVEVQVPALAATGSTTPWWASAVGILLLLGGALTVMVRTRARAQR